MVPTNQPQVDNEPADVPVPDEERPVHLDDDGYREAVERDPESVEFLQATCGYFGCCPVCHSENRPHEGGYKWRNVRSLRGQPQGLGKEHWCSCEVHCTRWPLGWNLSDSWHHENETVWAANEAHLAGYREVEPWVDPYWVTPRDDEAGQ